MEKAEINPQQINFESEDGGGGGDLSDMNSIESIELEYQNNRRFRHQKLMTLKKKFNNASFTRERKSQNIVFYFLNLLFPVMVSVVNASVFLQIGQRSELKGILVAVAAGGGLICAIISNIRMANWKSVLKLWLTFDSVVPVLIAAVIGFYQVWKFLNKGYWFHTIYAIAFPIWVIYMLGTLRVMIAYGNWSRWEVIVYKLTVLFAGLVNFYVGFEYMNGKYKVTKGFYISLETQLKDLTYLYVFGNVELFFEMFRRLSDFDQTNELKFQYKFKDAADEEKKAMAESELKDIQNQMVQEDALQAIALQMESVKRLESKMSKKQSSLKHSTNARGKKQITFTNKLSQQQKQEIKKMERQGLEQIERLQSMDSNLMKKGFKKKVESKK